MTPLPGNPGLVKAEASHMVEAAARMEQAAAALRDVAAHARSKAVDGMRDNAEKVAKVMTSAAIRYRGAGHALAAYAPVLEAAQTQAKRAIAQLGGTDVGSAQADVSRAELDPWEHLTLSEEEKTQRATELARAKSDLAEQRAAEAAAWALYADAKADVEKAAGIAMSGIQAANDLSALNDSFWDDFNGFVDKYVVPALNALTDILDVISDILGVIALVLAFIPGLQALAAAIGGLALVLKGISLLVTALLAFAGKKTWGDVLAKAITLALSIVLKGGASKAVGNLRALRSGVGKGDGLIARMSPGDLVRNAKGMYMLKAGDEGYKKAVEDVFKFGAKTGVEYGARFNEGSWDAKYDVDIAQAVTNSQYREGLTAGDYVGELINVVADPIGYVKSEVSGAIGDAVGGALDDLSAPRVDAQPVRVSGFGGGGASGGW